jgi:hypothetical protein
MSDEDLLEEEERDTGYLFVTMMMIPLPSPSLV